MSYNSTLKKIKNEKKKLKQCRFAGKMIRKWNSRRTGISLAKQNSTNAKNYLKNWVAAVIFRVPAKLRKSSTNQKPKLKK